MSYREENGQVVLTMSHQKYAQLMMVLGVAAAAIDAEHPLLQRLFNLVNDFNESERKS